MNEEEFIDFWIQAEPRIRDTLFRILGNRSIVDDVYQETWLRCQRGLATFQGTGSLIAWVSTIARNETLRYLRNAQRIQTQELFEETVPARDSENVQVEPLYAENGEESAARQIHNALQAKYITTAHAEVLLARLKSETLEEVAQELEISKSAAGVNHMRGVIQLRVFLFVENPNYLGGLGLIRQAFTSAKERSVNPITSKEAIAFEQAVLEPPSEAVRRRFKRSNPLRKACTKVATELNNL